MTAAPRDLETARRLAVEAALARKTAEKRRTLKPQAEVVRKPVRIARAR